MKKTLFLVLLLGMLLMSCSDDDPYMTIEKSDYTIEGFEDHSYMTKFLDYALSEFGANEAQVNLCDFKGSDGLSISLLT